MRYFKDFDRRFLRTSMMIAVSFFLSFAELNPVVAEEAKQNPSQAPRKKSATGETKAGLPEETLSVTRHFIEVNSKKISYTATAGSIQLKEETGKPRANMFFVSYVKDDEKDKARRPVTFAFNGGPGAASIFLHLGALGPKRALLGDEKALPPPYQLVTNEYTWLAFTDLVFIDPVGTGYSRPVSGVEPKEFYGVKGDIQSVGEFIRIYLTRYQRWLSPKFIAGESYGTTRAAGLSGYLQNKLGINLNGILLISEVLNFQTIMFSPGNDLPYILYLPPYTLAAWYHGKLSPGLEADLSKTREEVEQFALNEYTLALAKGDGLTDGEKNRLIEKLADYTGLSRMFIKNSNLRIPTDVFVKELLRNENRRIGLLDSRIAGNYSVHEFTEDPSVFVVTGPLVSTWNEYVRNDLKYATEMPYVILSTKVNELWDWGSGTGGLGYLDVAKILRQAMSENKFLKVFIASGFYDLDTSYFATKYTVNHLGLEPSLRNNITLAYYDGGHQMYTHLPTLRKLTADVTEFYTKALPSP
jgi:carboxypeptidase C (cathepsin A)